MRQRRYHRQSASTWDLQARRRYRRALLGTTRLENARGNPTSKAGSAHGSPWQGTLARDMENGPSESALRGPGSGTWPDDRLGKLRTSMQQPDQSTTTWRGTSALTARPEVPVSFPTVHVVLSRIIDGCGLTLPRRRAISTASPTKAARRSLSLPMRKRSGKDLA